MTHKDRRKSLTFRCRANPNDPLASVVDWLQNMDSRARKDKVERMLLALLPYAFEAEDKTKEEIENCYWDVHQRLQDFLFVMRQTLNIKVSISPSSYSEINIKPDYPEELVAPEEEDIVPEENQNSNEVSFSDFDSAYGA